nr:30S ribosomal protein S19e [Candidatus Bathyarchaeota archaeon]
MVSAYDVPAWDLIREVAKILKEEYPSVSPPPGYQFWKTGVHKEVPPEQADWWYIRCASILRKLYVHGPVGVSRLRTAYGGRKRRGVRPEHFAKGSGSIIRRALQQLEEAGLVEKVEKEGRRITNKGRSLLDRTAYKISLKLRKEIPEIKSYL